MTSPFLLLTLVATLLLGGLAQPVVNSACPSRSEVSPTDAAQAEAVVRDLIAALSAGAAPGADASAITAAEAAVDQLMGSMVSFEGVPGSPPPALAAIAYLWLPHPTDSNTPLTVGEPLELIGLPPMDGRNQIALTVEVSNGSETRTLQFRLLREGSAWRVEMSVPVALDPVGCYVIEPPEMVHDPEEGGVSPPVVVGGGPVVVAVGSPVTVGEGAIPPDAPPHGDPGEQVPAEPTGPIGLHLVNADGSGLTHLSPNGGWPAWSPDRTRIAFNSIDPANPAAPLDIAVMQADGSGVTPLAHTPWWDHTPTWSPDGTRIAFLSQYDVQVALYVVNADGSDLIKLADAAQTSFDSFPTPPAWSPDGTKIAFAGPGAGNNGNVPGSIASEVWVVDADGSDLTQVTDLSGSVSNPTWSPDGNHLAFAHTIYEDTGITAPDGSMMPNLAGNALYVMNPDGSELTALTEWKPPASLDMDATRPAPPEPRSTAIQSTPRWSHDGSRLAFASIWGLALIDADGSGLTVHPVDDLHVTDPVWSPDGTQLAFSGATYESYPDIYLVNADGSGLTRLAGTDWIDVAIAWSPDGSRLAFTATPPLGD